MRAYASEGVPDLKLGAEIKFKSGFTFWLNKNSAQALAADAAPGLTSWILQEEADASVTMQSVSALLLSSLALLFHI